MIQGTEHRSRHRLRQQLLRELLRLVVAERVELEDPRAVFAEGARAVGLGIGEQRAEGRCVAVVAPEAADQHHRGWLGGADHVEEQGGAVDVAPLEVVDVDHQAAPIADPSEQLAEGAEGAASELELVLEAAASGGRVGDGVAAVEHREDAGEGAYVAGQERLDLEPRQAA